MNLVPAIREMKEEIDALEDNYKAKKHDLEEGLSALRKLNTVCEECGGSGKYLRSRVCAEDDRPDPENPRDYRTCSRCHGTGKAVNT